MSFLEFIYSNMSFDDRLNAFLQLLKEKALALPETDKGFQACINEPYGILGPLDVRYFTSACRERGYAEKIKAMNVPGILVLNHSWRQMKITLWDIGDKFLPSGIHLHNHELGSESQSHVNQKMTEKIFFGIKYYLDLLHFAHTDNLLHHPAVYHILKNYIDAEPEFKDLSAEFSITLMKLKLTAEEHDDQEAFFKRGKAVLRDTIRFQSEFFASDTNKAFAGLAATYGCNDLLQKYAGLIETVWGILIDVKYQKEEVRSQQTNYAVIEKYHSNGRITVEGIISVAAGKLPYLNVKSIYDQYFEIYSDYETAKFCRETIINTIKEITHEKLSK